MSGEAVPAQGPILEPADLPAMVAAIDSGTASGAALQQAPWRSIPGLSSALAAMEQFLASAGFDRAPWLAVGFATGIAAWFALPAPSHWLALIAGALGISVAALVLFAEHGQFPYLRQSLAALGLALAAGCGVVWVKSTLVGAAPIERPMVADFAGRVLSRQEQPADGRVRLVLATREPGSGRPIRVRVNLPLAYDSAQVRDGVAVRLRARLIGPAPPMLPGGYDFARSAWFGGLAATGTALGPVELLGSGDDQGAGWLSRVQRSLAAHVHSKLEGSPGGIAAAFASGDRGAIAQADEDAMRDAGLTHLLSVSGLHVAAVIGAAYLIALRLLALWPALALRVRLPLVGAAIAASVGLGYTLLTGAEVPTVRSVIGSLLVLAAVALGREPLSLRMLAVAGFGVMLLWPEAVVGPSFQLSFGAVLAIIALHGSAPMRRFTAKREEPAWARLLRHLGEVLLTGMVIELAILPVTLYHFHRAGLYGAFANVVAIPLTTFVSMPFIAIALLFDLVGAGAPAWWVVGKSLSLLLWIAHLVARQPGAVTLLPAMGGGLYVVFLAGGLWLALWRGRMRLWGLLPVLVGAVGLLFLRPPDVLVSGDGRHIGFTGLSDDGLVVLRQTRSEFALDNLGEQAGMSGPVTTLADWPGARCNDDFCALQLHRGGRNWRFLLSRGNSPVPLRDLAAACERADIVISDRRLPWSCRPAVLKADRTLLDRTGGLAFDLERGKISTVAEEQGEHGWWHPFVRPRWDAGPQQGIAATQTTGSKAQGEGPDTVEQNPRSVASNAVAAVSGAPQATNRP